MATAVTDQQFLTYRRARLLLLAVFVLSRAAYFAAGLRFNTAPLTEFWQMVDLPLLRTDLLRSIWYLHMQPPGYNLLTGILLKLFPVHFGAALWVIQVVCGVSIALNMLRLIAWMRVPLPLSLGLTVFFVISPATLLYENAAVYDYLVCALLLASATALIRFFEEPRPSPAMEFFGWLTVLAFIRNLFHIVYLLLLAVLLLALFPRGRKAVLAGAIPALLIVASIYVKNGVLFGRYVNSTWQGMQFGRITTDQLSPAEAAGLIASGTVSPFAAIPTFSPLRVYLPLMSHIPPKTGIPVLDEAVTSTGYNNYNASPYLEVHDQYAADAKQVLIHKPAAFLRSLESGWFCYFRPSSDLAYHFGTESAPIAGWERIFSAVFYGQLRRASQPDQVGKVKALFHSGNLLAALTFTGCWLVLILPVVTAWAFLQFFVPAWKRNWTQKQLMMMGYLLLTIAFVTLLVNTISFQENNRYRFPLDPFFLALLGMAIAWLRTRIRRAPRRLERENPVVLG